MVKVKITQKAGITWLNFNGVDIDGVLKADIQLRAGNASQIVLTMLTTDLEIESDEIDVFTNTPNEAGFDET